MPRTIERPDTRTETKPQRLWKVILFNDNIHTIDEVILQVQKATGCSLQQAESVTLIAHRRGQAVAFEGPLERCEHVAAVLGRIRLRVAID